MMKVERAGQFASYLLFRGAEALLGLLSLGAAFRLGGMLGRVAAVVLPGYRRLARHNLEVAFGGSRPADELDRMARDVFQRLGANLLAGARLARMGEAEVAGHFAVVGLEAVEAQVAESGRGVVWAIAHLGCWELLAHIPAMGLGGRRRGSLFQPLGNPFLDRHVKRLREGSGAVLLDRRDGFGAPVRLLAAGGTLGLLFDQHAGDKGLWCPLFGRLASTTNLTALLAKRGNALVVPLSVRTTGEARWRVEVGEPLAEGSPEEMTVALNRRLEGLVEASPEDWFWFHRRWKTPQPNFLFHRYKRGVALPADMAAGDLQRFRILVRSPNWLGDACMSVPAVRAIKRGRPDAHVTVLAPAKLAGLWEMVDEVDAVCPIGAGEGLLRTAARVRSGGGAAGFDVGVLMPNSTRSALEMKLGGLPEIAGYAGSFRRRLLTVVVRSKQVPGPVRHHRFHYLDLAHAFGADTSDPTLVDPVTPPAGVAGPTPAPGRAGGEVRVGLCPGAEYGPAKRWLPERFAEVAGSLCDEDAAVRWSIFGVAADAPVAQAIEAALPAGRCDNRVGKTSLRELAAELGRCRLLLTNDTGTMHLAALLGVPTVAAFGSTEPAWTGPVGAGHAVVRHHVECSPCFLRECPIDFRCMRELETGPVRRAVREVLARDGRAAPLSG